ncbi:MAG: Asp-tRNA(Asn)/Glu-tRNA(Gln) amidotransferase subunit GatC [Candidatus Polarisedimenticolia bacterium]
MRITPDHVKRIAGLAQLNLSADEVDRLTGELDRILDYVAQLSAVDVEGVEPVPAEPGAEPLLRDDAPAACLAPEEALANSPSSVRGHFKVPRVIG